MISFGVPRDGTSEITDGDTSGMSYTLRISGIEV
jgi:hypothetical protein